MNGNNGNNGKNISNNGNNGGNKNGANRYRLIGMACTALIAAACFWAYFRGGAGTYPLVFAVCAVLFAVSGAVETLAAKESWAKGALSYFRPAMFYVLAAAAAALSAYLFFTWAK